ncbi:hypothetical protein AKJ57_00240, partial [candidate division MSBL1 archaeon SCGC-AAA259A05]
ERLEGSSNEGLKMRMRSVNWFGVAAGVLMLLVPFLGAWWCAEVGAEALKLELSPFYYHVSILEQPLTSSLVGYFILAAKLTVIIGGSLMIVGSLKTDKWWGKKLMRFGAMKVLWFLVMLLILLIAGTFFINNFLPDLIGGRGGNVEIQIPYIIGTSNSVIQSENVTVVAPTSASLTPSFWVAVLTAFLGIVARIYHGRIEKRMDAG